MNSYSTQYTGTYVHTEKITYTNTSCKTNKDSRQRQANNQAPFSLPTHKYMHINTHGNAHIHTASDCRHLIEVSVPAIVFVHLGMKEPFWPVLRRQQCGTTQAGAQISYVCLSAPREGKQPSVDAPHYLTHPHTNYP